MRKVAVIATASSSGEIGGAERFYFGLRDALCGAGVDATVVSVVSDESTFETIEESYLRFYDLDLSAYDGVISTKAPGYVVRHPNHVCYLQHTMRVFYDMFESEFPHPSEKLLSQRQLIHRLDTAALQRPRTRNIFVIGHEVNNRLRDFNRLTGEVLYQASTMTGFHSDGFDYLFMPGRLHRWKRVDLVIEAVMRLPLDIQLLISGTGEDEDRFRKLAGNDNRIHFLGRVTDSELLDLYARALAVTFVPRREDFGLVTLEAFHSCKPVITCVDSGEPTYLVRDGVNGYVCEPDPDPIAARIAQLHQDEALARRMGEAGKASIAHITWDRVATRLLEALGMGLPVGQQGRGL